MDPLNPKYSVYPSTPDTEVSIGDFDLKWTTGVKTYPAQAYGNGYGSSLPYDCQETTFYARYKKGSWKKETLSIYLHPGLPLPEPFRLEGIHPEYSQPLYEMFATKQKGPDKPDLVAFKAAVAADYKAWRSARKKLRQANKEVDPVVQAEFDKAKARKKIENSVEITKLKISVLPKLDKIRIELEACADAIVNNTFTGAMASDLRWKGKSLGGTGIGSELRSLASLISKNGRHSK